MIRAILTGRLHGDPQPRTSSSDKPFATAGVWVDTEADQRLWCSAIAFGSTADRLLQLKAGDALALSGRLTPKVYAKDGGEPRVSLDMQADEVATVRRKPRQRDETEAEG